MISCHAMVPLKASHAEKNYETKFWKKLSDL